MRHGIGVLGVIRTSEALRFLADAGVGDGAGAGEDELDGSPAEGEGLVPADTLDALSDLLVDASLPTTDVDTLAEEAEAEADGETSGLGDASDCAKARPEPCQRCSVAREGTSTHS